MTNQPAPEKCCPTCGSPNPKRRNVRDLASWPSPIPEGWRLAEIGLMIVCANEDFHAGHGVLPVEPQPAKCGHPVTRFVGYCIRDGGHRGHCAVETVPVVPPAQVEEGFEVNIICHTADAQQRMSDPEHVRHTTGAALDALGLQEEVDYTLEVRRTYESK